MRRVLIHTMTRNEPWLVYHALERVGLLLDSRCIRRNREAFLNGGYFFNIESMVKVKMNDA